MLNSDNLKATGWVDVVIRDPEGRIKEERHIPNVVVDDGEEFIASRMAGTSASVMSHMEVGTDNTAAAETDTALVSAVSGGRVSLDSATPSGSSIAYVATFPAGTATDALTEAGIFNAASGGTMLCRTVFSVINKGASDSMTITWTITIA